MFGMTKDMINVKDGYPGTALMNAAMEGHGEIVELLLERGADVDMRSSGIHGFQAIHYATICGHLDVAKLIASKHPHVLKARTNNRSGNKTPLWFARDRNHNHIINWLQTERGVTE